MTELLEGLDALVQTELRVSAPPGTRPEPPPGIYLQLYRGALRGTPQAKRDQLAGYCDQVRDLGLPGVVFHGFPREIVGAWPGLAALAHDRGLLALAAWGLDGSKDTDGSRLTADEKGDLAGQVLADPTCAAGLLDAEGQFDSDLGPADDMDEAGALALGRALRRRAPDAWVGDQPWYAIEAHGDLRRTARPLELGGPFRGFPVDEFAATATWGRFRQADIYRDKGALYGHTFARMDREWADITPTLRAAGLERPLRVTLQGYGWLLHEQVHALLERSVRPVAPLVVWCDPWPDATCLRALWAVLWLQREGYAGPGVDPREAVRAAQRVLGVTADGWWGEDTARAAGLWA